MLKTDSELKTQRLFCMENAVLTVSTILISIPLLIGMLYVKFFGVNVPYWDQWGLVPLLDKFYSHTLTLNDLFVQHNEHRVFFPKLIMLISAYFTNYNIVIEMYLSYLLACVTIGLLFIIFVRQFTSIKKALILFIPVSWMFFNFNQWENILWGWQIAIYLCVFGLVASLYLLEKAQKPGLNFFLSILLAVVSSFSFINGLMAWPAGLFLILISKSEGRWRLAAPWMASGIATWAIYFYGWVKPAYHPSLLYPILHPATSLLYYFAIIGAAISQYIYLAVACGMAIVSIAIVALWLVARDQAWKQNGFWLSIVLFSLLSALLCVGGRSGFGVTQALSSRYITLMIPGLLGIYAVVCYLINKKPESTGRFAIYGILITILAVGILAGYLDGYAAGKTAMESRAGTIDIIKDYQNASDDALKTTYPDPAALRSDIQILQKYKLNVFS